MKFLIMILLAIAAYFSLTPFAPAPAGSAWIGWPFAADSASWLPLIGGLPSRSGLVTTLLAGVAGLCFIGAFFSLLHVVVPSRWWTMLILVGASASLVLFILYFGVLSLIPIGINLALLSLVLMEYWAVEAIFKQ